VDISYGYNNNIPGTNELGNVTASSTKLSGFTSGSKTVLLFEVFNSTNDPSAVPNLSNTPFDARGNGVKGSDYDQNARFATGNLDNSLQDWGVVGGVPGITYYWNDYRTSHFDGANYLAVDGHVKFLRPSQISAGRNAANASAAQVSQSTAEGAGGTAHALTFSVK
jgi:prepilin-type processing-associated H-X9-DG protein